MSDEAQEGEDVVRIVPLGKGKRPAALGRGLSALLGDIQTDVPVNNPSSLRDGFSLLAIADVHPHPLQPRRRFDEDALKELAESIAARGVVQPILVRPAPNGQGYQLVAGERRWRASQRAGLHHIPAIVRDLDETETFTIALIENIQRQDLTAIEEAEAYARLRDQLGHSQDAIGQMTGKSRSHIANILRLLELPEAVRDMIADGRLGMGHARALIGLDDAEQLARKIVIKGLSVRKVEAMVRATKRQPGGMARPGSTKGAPDADIAALENHLSNLLGLKVRISHQPDQMGTLSLDYTSLEQLDMLCQRLSGEQL